MTATAGNAGVIEALETMLAEARKGRACFLIATMIDVAGNPMGGWFGAGTHERVCMDRLEKMCCAMDQNILNRTLPDRDPAVSADRVCLNVAAGFGMSFDFFPWLVHAEMERVRQGAPAPLKVAFWRGRDGQVALPPESEKFLQHVVRPALALFGAVEDATAVDGRFAEQWTTNVICAAARRGATVPTLRVPATPPVREFIGKWLHGEARPVTITLREISREPQRNSNLDAWRRFARYLRQRGENVIVVRDTAHAYEPFGQYRICPEASLDLHLRAALYEGAKCNLFVANGPVSLAMFGSRPWLCFTEIFGDDHNYLPATPKFWRESIGVEPGGEYGQYPWSSSDQRIVWSSDTFENLVAAWEALYCKAPLAMAG